jgi:nucleoside-diphosphate-sugar epimerase
MSGRNPSGTRVAITGGTEFVGGHLATHLVRQGHQVVLVARGGDQRPWVRQVLGLPHANLAPDGLPADLVPSTEFDVDNIRAGLPEPGRFDRTDLRCWRVLAHAVRVRSC